MIKRPNKYQIVYLIGIILGLAILTLSKISSLKLVLFYLPNIAITFLVFATAFLLLYELQIRVHTNVFLANIYEKYKHQAGKAFAVILSIVFVTSALITELEVRAAPLLIAHYTLIALSILYGLFLISKNKLHALVEPADDHNQKRPIRALIVVSLFFVLLVLSLPIFNTSSYVDEYYHIFSGLDYFQFGHFSRFTTDASYYDRGIYASVLAGSVFSIFGRSLYAAKLIPAIIGIVNFFLVQKLSKRLTGSQIFAVFIAIIYTISPWVIFNHFYIRFFVFYELFFLIVCYSALLLIENKYKSLKHSLPIWALFLITNVVSWFLSNDNGKYFIAIPSLVVGSYLFINRFKLLNLGNYYLVKKLNSPFVRSIALGVIGIVAFKVLGLSDKVTAISSGIIEFGAGTSVRNYYTFFFEQNSLLSILFFTGLFSLHQVKHRAKQLIMISLAFIFLVLFSLNIQIQVIRVILFLLPVFYLISFDTLHVLASVLRQRFVWAIAGLIAVTLILSYPPSFFTKITLPNEITMHKTDQAGRFMQTSCSNKNKYVLYIEPHLFSFYLGTDYSIFYVQTSFLPDDSRFYKASDKAFKVVFKDIPVISDRDKIKNIVASESNCFLLYNNDDFNWRYADEQILSTIKSTYQSVNFGEVSVYYN